ncbi:MAG TPA: phasyl DNA replicon protein arp, partial [Terriglobia bacterium]|nr:phasyl DNA replicon protein arp [Terriglobia bacterium]
MIDQWGVDNVLFVTLTFGGGKRGPTVKQAEKAFHSFLTHGLGARFLGGVKILERGDKNGRVHFHLLVNAGEDVRTGTDFAALERGDYSTVSAACRRAYAWFRANAVKYGFGRIVNCLPIKSTAEGAARYVSKYISKHFGRRRAEDKGARLRAYWG